MERNEIFKKYRYKCIRCRRKATQIHEIIPKSRNIDWDKDEFEDERVPLCDDCHNWAHSQGTSNSSDELYRLRDLRLVQYVVS